MEQYEMVENIIGIREASARSDNQEKYLPEGQYVPYWYSCWEWYHRMK